jgi:CMP/dCMP kinase
MSNKIKKTNIAIDGPAGSGKTTVGKLLAQKTGYQFLDSGLLYRHFAFLYHNKKVSLEMKNLLSFWEKEINADPGKIILDLEKNRELFISSEIGVLASQLAPDSSLRKIILDFQRKLTKNKGWIVVGRDITSEVLPQAEVKIFLTADLENRAERRYQQYSKKITKEEIKKELQARDKNDKGRKNSPLIKTLDSWELDTTHLSPEETVEMILSTFGKELKC